MSRFDYEYEFDGQRVDRWHLPSERLKTLPNRVADEFTAIRRAQADFAKVKTLAANSGKTVTAVWNYGGGKRVPLGEAR